MRNKKVAIGLLTGLTSGALMGIAVTSKRGNMLRKKMFNKVDKYFSDLRLNFDRVLSSKNHKNVAPKIEQDEESNSNVA